MSHAPSPAPRRRGATSCAASASPWPCRGWSRCPRFAQPAAGAAAAAAEAPAPPGHRLLLERRRAGALVGQGQRRHDGARAGPAADAAASRRHGLRPGPVQPVGLRLDEPAPRPHEPALGRPGQPRPRTRSASARRWTRSLASGHRRPDRRPEPRARHRAQRAAARGRPLDDLRLEHLVDLADASRPTKEIYPARAFDRLVGDGTGRALDRSILDAVRAESQSLEPRSQPATTATSWTSTSRASATSRSGSSGPRRRSGSKAGARRSPSPTCRARSTSCRRTSRTT